MSLIDKTYFVKDISLDTGTTSNIDNNIEKYERELIEKLFDYEDAQLILDNDSATWVQNVIDGAEYIVAGTTYKWKGLANTEKESPIAYWVYYWHLRNISSITGGIGNAQMKLENANNISFGQKIGVAWIRMEKLLYELYDYLSNEYPEKNFYMIEGNINMFDL